MNHRRVQRVLDLVRDAGGQPAERRQLARVAERRTAPASGNRVARDEHHGASRCRARRSRASGSGVRAAQAARSSTGRRAASAVRRRSARATGAWPSRLRRPSDTDARPAADRARRASGSAASRQRRAHGRVGEQQLRRRRLKMATASSSGSIAGVEVAAGWPSAARSADSRALTVLKNSPSSPNSSRCGRSTSPRTRPGRAG